MEQGGRDGFGTAAYGGPGWRARSTPHGREIGRLWGPCGIDSEWAPLRAVLLRRPGPEIAVEDWEAAQHLGPVDPGRAGAEHDALAEAYRSEGVAVDAVPANDRPTPNAMFCADLFAMTPEGAILGRPASEVRAGEEVAVARALAAAGVPILATLTGRASFEGADLMWLDQRTALLGRGHRTNAEGAEQVAACLARIGCETVVVDLPWGTMHLMGMLRIIDRDLAVAWPRRTPLAAVEALEARGLRVEALPTGDARKANRGLNMVTLGPRRVLMPAGAPGVADWLGGLGVAVRETPVEELAKAAGAVGCLTGVIARGRAGERP